MYINEFQNSQLLTIFSKLSSLVNQWLSPEQKGKELVISPTWSERFVLAGFLSSKPGYSGSQWLQREKLKKMRKENYMCMYILYHFWICEINWENWIHMHRPLTLSEDQGVVGAYYLQVIPNLLTNYPMKLHEIKTMCTNITLEYICKICSV